MRRWLPLVAAIIAVGFAGWLLATLVSGRVAEQREQEQYDALVSACERGNTIRREINDRSRELETIRDIIVGNLQAAKQADASDSAAVEVYQTNIDRLLSIDPEPISLPVCADAFPRP